MTIYKITQFPVLMWHRKGPLETKVKCGTLHTFYKVLLVQLVYGSESWTLTKQQTRRTEVVEIRRLRSVAGYRLFDKTSNRNTTQELRINYLSRKIKTGPGGRVV
jgi:hypothetical protein